MNKKYFYLSLAIIPIVIGMIGFMALLQSPYTGLDLKYDNNKWYISSIDPGGPAADHKNMVESEVISIAGFKISGSHTLAKEFDDISKRSDFLDYLHAQAYFHKNIHIGELFSIVIQNNNSIQNIQITPSNYPFIQFIKKAGIIFLTGFITILIGLTVIFQKPENEQAAVFYILTLFISLVDFTLGIFVARDLSFDMNIFYFIYVAGSIGFFYSAAVLFHFVNIFPRHTRIGNNRKILFFLYLITFLGVILYDLKIFYYAYPILCGLMLTAGMIIVLRSYFVLHSPETKTQVRVILYGTGLALATFPVLYFGPMLFTGGRVFSAYLPMIASVLLPLSMAFAITRYRLMDIDTLFDNTLIYVTTLLLLVLTDAVLVNILMNFKFIALNNFLFTLVSVWFIIFAYIPVRNFVQNIMKKLLRREIYDINAISLQLSKELLSASGIEDAFRKVSFAVTDAIHPKGWAAYLINPNGSAVSVWEENGMRAPLIDIDKITTLLSPVQLSAIAEAKDIPIEYAGGIYVPIIGSQRQIGYFVFQNKHSDRLYDKNDIKLLSIASNQLAMAVEALKAQENAAQERERISREVHDCVGNSFAQAIFISDTINKNTDNPNVLKYSQNLKNILSTGLDNTRDLLWAVEKNENSLGNLISYICNKICVTTNSFESRCISDSIEDDKILLSSIVRLNIIRVIEETTSNIIKHAKASKLEITFVQSGQDFTITIKDNGIGFNLAQENVSPNGYGLRNIRKRCDEIGAQLDIESSDAGTQITVNLRLG